MTVVQVAQCPAASHAVTITGVRPGARIVPARGVWVMVRGLPGVQLLTTSPLVAKSGTTGGHPVTLRVAGGQEGTQVFVQAQEQTSATLSRPMKFLPLTPAMVMAVLGPVAVNEKA